MSRVLEAIYEGGVFRPLTAVLEVPDGARVLLTVRKPSDKEALRKLSVEDAEEMMQTIRDGRRAEGDWQLKAGHNCGYLCASQPALQTLLSRWRILSQLTQNPGQ